MAPRSFRSAGCHASVQERSSTPRRWHRAQWNRHLSVTFTQTTRRTTRRPTASVKIVVNAAAKPRRHLGSANRSAITSDRRFPRQRSLAHGIGSGTFAWTLRGTVPARERIGKRDLHRDQHDRLHDGNRQCAGGVNPASLKSLHHARYFTRTLSYFVNYDVLVRMRERDILHEPLSSGSDGSILNPDITLSWRPERRASDSLFNGNGNV